jgi:hypothetical protein
VQSGAWPVFAVQWPPSYFLLCSSYFRTHFRNRSIQRTYSVNVYVREISSMPSSASSSAAMSISV